MPDHRHNSWRDIAQYPGWQECCYVGCDEKRRRPDAAHARQTDPETSHEAAERHTPETLRLSQQEVLRYLQNVGPMTDEEVLAFARISGSPQTDSGLRTRRAELVRKGEVQFAGQYRKTAHGNRSRVWATAGKETP